MLAAMGTSILIAVLAAVLLAIPGARADERQEDHERARAALERGEVAPLAKAIAKVQSLYAGDVVETEIESEHGRFYYEIKLLTPEGRVLKLLLDARTLEIVKVKGHPGRDGRRK